MVRCGTRSYGVGTCRSPGRANDSDGLPASPPSHVVVDDAEDDLDARLMQQGDHAAELSHDCLGTAGTRFGGRVGGSGAKKRVEHPSSS